MLSQRFCTVTASTKRSTLNPTTKRRSTPTTYLSSLLITPLYPVSQAIVKLLDLNSPREVKEVYHVPLGGAALPDVVEGDVLVIGGNEYSIVYVGEWSTNRLKCLQVVVQEQKQNA